MDRSDAPPLERLPPPRHGRKRQPPPEGSASSQARSYSPLLDYTPGVHRMGSSPLWKERDATTATARSPLDVEAPKQSLNPFARPPGAAQRERTARNTAVATAAASVPAHSLSERHDRADHIFYQHGMRLVENAEIRLEALPFGQTWVLFLLPYLCLVISVWLALSGIGTATQQLATSSCDAQGACSWAVNGAPPLNSFLRLTGRFKVLPGVTSYPPSTSSLDCYYTLGIAVEISGCSGPGDSVALLSMAAGDNRHTIRCSVAASMKGGGKCEPATLFDVLFDTPGMLGWYSSYRIVTKTTVIAGEALNAENVTISGSGAANGVVEGVGAGPLMAKATLQVQHEDSRVALAAQLARCVLVLVTAIGIISWLRVACVEQKGFFSVLAERQWLTLTLLALLLWQNPVLAVMGCLFGAGDRQLLVSDLLQSAGAQLLFFSWTSLMDGQHFVNRRHSPGDCVVRSNSSDVASSAALAPQPTARNLSLGEPRPYALLDDSLHPHDVRSDYFLDFVVGKAAYMLLALSVAVTLDLLRHPEVVRPPAALSGVLQEAYMALSLLAGALTVGWLAWFYRSAIRARRVLRTQPFMATRRQQLTYRVMLMQGLLVSVLLFVALSRPLWRLIRFLSQHTAREVLRATWLEAFWSEAASLAAWGRGFRTPLGELIFVSVICYTLVFLFLPPTHSLKRRHDRMYVSLERDLPPSAMARRYQELEPTFCLERACYLCEVSWQSYYDTKKLNLASVIAPGRMNLESLKLTLAAEIAGESLATRCLVCKGADRIVLVFRGTANMANARLDLKVGQVSLPKLSSAPRRNLGFPGSKAAVSRLDSDEHDSSEGEFEGKKGGYGTSGGYSSFGNHQESDSGNLFGRFDARWRRAVSAVPLAAQTLPRVHQGFWEAYMSVRERVLQAVAAELENDYKPLFITGHSLGGALATLAAYDIKCNFNLPDEVVLYTFGSPSVGNYAFARLAKKRVPHHFRVVNDGDFVTTVLPQFFGIYRHAGIKVLIDSDCFGTFIVSPSAVEDVFGSKGSSNPYIHLLAQYRESLEACMEPADLHEYVAKGYPDKDNVPEWLLLRRRRGDTATPTGGETA